MGLGESFGNQLPPPQGAVTDSWDINGAASAGLTTFWIQRTAGEPPEELGFPAHRVVRAITDLAPLVSG